MHDLYWRIAQDVAILTCLLVWLVLGRTRESRALCPGRNRFVELTFGQPMLYGAANRQAEKIRDTLNLTTREVQESVECITVWKFWPWRHFDACSVGAHYDEGCAGICLRNTLVTRCIVWHEAAHALTFCMPLDAIGEWLCIAGENEETTYADYTFAFNYDVYEKCFSADEAMTRYTQRMMLKDHPILRRLLRYSVKWRWYPRNGMLSRYGASNALEDIAVWTAACYGYCYGRYRWLNPLRRIKKKDPRNRAKLEWLHRNRFITDRVYAAVLPRCTPG